MKNVRRGLSSKNVSPVKANPLKIANLAFSSDSESPQKLEIS